MIRVGYLSHARALRDSTKEVRATLLGLYRCMEASEPRSFVAARLVLVHAARDGHGSAGHRAALWRTLSYRRLGKQGEEILLSVIDPSSTGARELGSQ